MSNKYLMATSKYSEQDSSSLEINLVIYCSQTHINSIHSKKISELLSRDLNWRLARRIAERNGVFPIFAHNLLSKFETQLSAENKAVLSGAFQEHLGSSFFLTGQLVEAVRKFKDENIPVMPFKGPLLADRIYKNVALRKYLDLDVLIHPQYLKSSIKLLQENGYKPTSNIDWLNKPSWNINRKFAEFNQKDITFYHEETQVVFELHWKLSGSYFALPQEANRLWDQAEKVKIAGVEVNTLSFNDLLIYLCLHGSRHNWERLGWIADVNELIKSEKEIDWIELQKHAQRLGCEKVFELGLYLVHEFFGETFPLTNWQEIENNPAYRSITDQICSYMFLEEHVEWQLNDTQAYQLKLREKFWDKFKMNFYYDVYYLTLRLKNKTPNEDFYKLPAWLIPVYYIVRPMRSFFKSFKKERVG